MVPTNVSQVLLILNISSKPVINFVYDLLLTLESA